MIGLAPHAEVTLDTIAHDVAGARIGTDGEPDCGGGTHVGGAPHGSTERLSEHARHGGKFGTAAGHIQRIEQPVGMRRKEFGHYFGCTFHQRPAKFVIRRNGDRNLAPAFAHALKIRYNPPGVGIQRLLPFPALLEQAERFGIGERFSLNAQA